MRPAGTRVAWLDDLELADELWARLGDPDRARVLHDSTARRARPSPSTPARRARPSRELDLDAWDELEAANPELEGLEPDAEALIVNRLADPPAARDRSRSTSATGWSGLSRRLGGDLRRRRGRSGDRELLRRAAGAATRHERSPPEATRQAPRLRPTAPEPEFEIVSAEPVRAPRRRRSGSTAAISDRSGPPVYTIALTALITIEPAKRTYDAGRRASDWWSCSASPSAGRRPPARSAGHRWTSLVPGFTGVGRVRAAGPVHLRPRGRRGQVLRRRSPAARRRCGSTSTARSSTRTRTGGMQLVQVPWDRSSASRCRSRPGGG